ncbi:MAG TPA: hypothetical protein VFI73_12365 [Candidatus Nitrosopolaris sp.]|nr:hypothetical protein [Candidatus Nitrosopolaris sp.]
MITKKRNLLIIAVLAVTASITSGILSVTYIQQAASAQNQNSTSNAGAIPLKNLTGSVQLFPKLSQTIQSKANVSLSAAASIAEKAVGPNSHVISAHLGVVNGFLVYSARVVDSSNNIHRVIVDAGNGKVLSTIQLPFANVLIHPGGRGMFGHYCGGGMYGHSKGFFSGHRGLNNNVGPSM